MNLNKITYNEDLTILTQTAQPIRAYAQQANTIEVLAPVSGFNTAYIVLQGLASGVVNPRLRATQRLFMSPLSDEGNYKRWNMVIPGAILNDMSLMNSTGVRMRVEFWYISGDCLGVEKYNTEVGIADLLAADYPDATDGKFVRVIDTNTDWYYDLATTTWIDYESQYQVGVSVQPTSSADFALEKGIYTEAPSYAPTNTELILQQLAAKLGLIGGTMTGPINMGSQKVTMLANGTVSTDAVNKGQLDTVDDDVTALETANMFKSVSYASATGILTFTRYDDTTTAIDFPLELIVQSGSYDAVNNEIVLVLADSSEIRIPVDNLLTDLDAVNVRYSNATSGLTAENVQGAIDELQQLKISKDFTNYLSLIELSPQDEIIVRDVSTNETKKTSLNYLMNIDAPVTEYGVRWVLGQTSPTGERVKKYNGVMTIGEATNLYSIPATSVDGVGLNTFDSIFRTELVSVLNSNGDANTFARRHPYFIKEEIVNDGSTIYEYLWVSETELDGYRIPLSFLQTDGSVSYYDIGHEEGIIDSNGRLRSIADGEFPTTTQTRGAFRTAARKNDGDGTNTTSKYQITDLAEYNDLVQIPMMIEFATRDLQSIFRGHVDSTYDANTVTDGASVEGASTAIISNTDAVNFPIGQGVYISTDSKLHTLLSIDIDTPIAGQSTLTFDGDAVAILTGANLDPRQWNTGNFKNAKYHSCYYSSTIATGKQPFMWRYIVNPFGNQWKFVDGLKIVDWQTWVTTNPADYDDAASSGSEYASPFVKLNYVQPQVNGYVKELGLDERYPFARLPKDNSGSSSTYFSDYYYQASGDRTALVGGYWSDTSGAGPFCWVLYFSLALAFDYIGSRLSHRP